MSAYDVTGFFLRTAYRLFAYCVSSKHPLNTAYQKGVVTLRNGNYQVCAIIKQTTVMNYSFKA